MQAEHAHASPTTLAHANNLIAIGTGAVLLTCGAIRRSPLGPWIAAAAVPFFYRGIVGHWPEVIMRPS